jgi:hypothetical protein
MKPQGVLIFDYSFSLFLFFALTALKGRFMRTSDDLELTDISPQRPQCAHPTADVAGGASLTTAVVYPASTEARVNVLPAQANDPPGLRPNALELASNPLRNPAGGPTDQTKMGTNKMSCDSNLSEAHNKETAAAAASSLRQQPLVADRVDGEWWSHPPRRHAFERPLHPLQVAAAVLKLVLLALYFTAVFPSLVRSGFVVFSAVSCTVLCASFVVVVVSQVGCSLTDIGDHGQEGQFCHYCERLVRDSSKHCKACNKCVLGFDHHCKWLNTCIGKANYRIFLTYVCSTVAASGTLVVSAVLYLTLQWHTLSEDGSNGSALSSTAAGSTYSRVGAVVLAVLSFLTWALLMHLLLFHVRLNYLKLTTFQFALRNS